MLLYNRLSSAYLLPTHQSTFAVGGSAPRRWPIAAEGDTAGEREAGPAENPTQRGKWAGSQRALCFGSLAGWAEEVNGSAGSARTKRPHSSGARARVRRACRAFPTEPGLSALGGSSQRSPAVSLVLSLTSRVPPPLWGLPLPLCPRLVDSQPRSLYTQLEGVRVRGEGR